MTKDIKTATSDDLAAFYFHQGTNNRAYEYLGCHHHVENGMNVYTFRTWAPNADSVEVVGDFNGWKPTSKMRRITDMGVYEDIITSEKPL